MKNWEIKAEYTYQHINFYITNITFHRNICKETLKNRLEAIILAKIMADIPRTFGRLENTIKRANFDH